MPTKSLNERAEYDRGCAEGYRLGQKDLVKKLRAEIEKLDEGITSYHNDKPWVYKSEVLEIIDHVLEGD